MTQFVFLPLRAVVPAIMFLLLPVIEASAQTVLLPELVFSYSEWPREREATPEDPMQEPVVSLASLVMALGEALAGGGFKLESDAALALELQLSALIDTPVLSRAMADRYATELAGALDSRQLITLVRITQIRDYAGRPGLLGADAATANPFYNPGSFPGHGARFVLARLDSILRPKGDAALAGN